MDKPPRGILLVFSAHFIASYSQHASVEEGEKYQQKAQTDGRRRVAYNRDSTDGADAPYQDQNEKLTKYKLNKKETSHAYFKYVFSGCECFFGNFILCIT